MVGEPDTVAVFADSEAMTLAATLAAEAAQWRNELAARSLFSVIHYRPGARQALDLQLLLSL